MTTEARNSDIAKEVYAELEAALGKLQEMHGLSDDDRKELKTVSNSVLEAETRLARFFRENV